MVKRIFHLKVYGRFVLFFLKTGGRQVVYAAGGERSGNTVQLLDYTQTETWETSKYKYLNQSTEGRS